MPDTAQQARLHALRSTIEAALTQLLVGDSDALSPRLLNAMRHSTLAGGKRLRALLCCTTAQACGGETASALPAACAVELLHSYSLIHDDLPAMDDDSLRRGLPTCHIVFDEAEAILAGDALQSLAFEVLANSATPQALAMVAVLATAAGPQGMVGGQSLDIAASGAGARTLTQGELERLHKAKTGALIRASMHMGALAADAPAAALQDVLAAGNALGLAFQVIDDVLDVSASSEALGKDAGSDVAQGKTTFVDLLGVDAARRYAAQLHEEADAALGRLGGDAEPLRAVARAVVFRGY